MADTRLQGLGHLDTSAATDACSSRGEDYQNGRQDKAAKVNSPHAYKGRTEVLQKFYSSSNATLTGQNGKEGPR